MSIAESVFEDLPSSSTDQWKEEPSFTFHEADLQSFELGDAEMHGWDEELVDPNWYDELAASNVSNTTLHRCRRSSTSSQLSESNHTLPTRTSLPKVRSLYNRFAEEHLLAEKVSEYYQ